MEARLEQTVLNIEIKGCETSTQSFPSSLRIRLGGPMRAARVAGSYLAVLVAMGLLGGVVLAAQTGGAPAVVLGSGAAGLAAGAAATVGHLLVDRAPDAG
jgi:hypothetical protein